MAASAKLHAMMDMPWMVVGDMNEIMYNFEKEGGNHKPNQFMISFREALDDCNLTDLGYVADRFTWHRGLMRERLDRAVSNEQWNILFPTAIVEHLEYHKSDHRPLVSMDESTKQEAFGPKIMRFEVRWPKEAKFREAASPHGPSDLANRLSYVHKAHHHWDKTVLRNSTKKLKKIQRELETVTRDVLSPENLARQKELADEIERLLQQEELYWAQRSRINWLSYGDQNTSHFQILHLPVVCETESIN